MQIFSDKKFENPIEIIEAFDNESMLKAFQKIEKLKNTHYLFGYIRYEAKDFFLNRVVNSDLPLLYFEVFDKYEEFVPEKFGYSDLEIVPQLDYAKYATSIEKIKEEISLGNTYQVNFTYDYHLFSKSESFALYQNLLQSQKTPYCAFIKNKYEEILSFSPELFFELEGDKILTKPMKGTVCRGKTLEEDNINIEFLKNDEKNRAENVMIVDLLRNDLGKIAKTASVSVDKLFEVETHLTVHQMTSQISAILKKNITFQNIFEAIFPCGSITGAPKINTMEIIEKLEKGKRGVYCGAIGLISPEKTIFSVPIRTLTRKNSYKFFNCRVGGAIVWDSTAEDEWMETLTKIKFLNPEFQLIETIKVENSNFVYGLEHFHRLKNSAQALGFEFNNKILELSPKTDGICRVSIYKSGEFSVDYIPCEDLKTNTVAISRSIIDSKNPLLFHKTSFRPWYKEAMEKISSNEIFDMIFFNEKGELTEGARSNIVLKIDDKFYTPKIESGILNGVMRQILVNNGADFALQNPPSKMISGEKFSKVTEKTLYYEDLKSAQKVYCINSVRGIVEVKVDFNR